MTTQTNENKFFNLTASCSAYVNDTRIVTPNGRKKDAFVSVKIAILEGPADEPETIFADLIVRGEQAKAIIKCYKDAWPSFKNKGKGWFAGLRLGSLYPKLYDSKGVTQATLGGRLLKLTYLKIGDDVINLSEFEKVQEETQEVA